MLAYAAASPFVNRRLNLSRPIKSTPLDSGVKRDVKYFLRGGPDGSNVCHCSVSSGFVVIVDSTADIAVASGTDDDYIWSVHAVTGGET